MSWLCESYIHLTDLAVAEETFPLWFTDEVLSHDEQAVRPSIEKSSRASFEVLLPAQRTGEGRMKEHSIGQRATFGGRIET